MIPKLLGISDCWQELFICKNIGQMSDCFLYYKDAFVWYGKKRIRSYYLLIFTVTLLRLQGKSQIVQDELVRLGEQMVTTAEGTRAIALQLCREFEETFLQHITTGEVSCFNTLFYLNSLQCCLLWNDFSSKNVYLIVCCFACNKKALCLGMQLIFKRLNLCEIMK